MSTLELKLVALKSKFSEDLSKDEALDLATQAAELLMQALSIARSKSEKSDLTERCKLLLDKAERIKESPDHSISGSAELLSFESLQLTSAASQTATKPASTTTRSSLSLASSKDSIHTRSSNIQKSLMSPLSTRELSKAEQIIVLKGSKLRGCTFRPWLADPEAEQFTLKEADEYYTDNFAYHLSHSQRDILDSWQRPAEALPPPSWRSQSNTPLMSHPSFPVMTASREPDLVQDAATDCSLVASLASVTARTWSGHSEIISSGIFPYGPTDQSPRISPNGKYIFRLNFNGCSREVVIDDRLPVSKTTRLLHVVDRNNPSMLWPALLEKAYLKVRGGYDFPGSNSGTDLWIVSGWIPEQVFLQHDDTVPGDLWSRMNQAFKHGDVIITMGTGKMTQKAEKETGLAGEHDYAVLQVKERDGQKFLLVKNPWLNAINWNSHRLATDPEHIEPEDLSRKSRKAQDVHQMETTKTPDTNEPSQSPSTFDKDGTPLSPGTFWMQYNDVLQYFESIYLNWNPGLFSYRQDVHFTWDLVAERSAIGSFMQNPQHVVKTTSGADVWLLLSKHFMAEPIAAHADASAGERGFISLYALHGHDHRVHRSSLSLKPGVFVDSPQTLLPLERSSGETITVVTAEEGLPNRPHTFTISAFSTLPLSLEKAPPAFAHRTKLKSAWTKDSAGGNAGSPTYSQNPQYSLSLPSASNVSIVLETLTSHTSLQVKLLRGGGNRVFSVSRKDVVIDSGEYRQGVTIAQLDNVVAGTYTIICSTFEAGQLADFVLFVETNNKHVIETIAKEGAGRIKTRFADASFGAGVRLLAAPVAPLRLAKVFFTAKHALTSADSPRSVARATFVGSPMRLTIERGRGPDLHVFIASGNGSFTDPKGGMRTEDVDLNPRLTDKKDMWLVLERMTGFDETSRAEERINVEMFADVPNAMSIGVWREWER